MIAQVLGLLMQTSVPPPPHDLGFLTAEALAERCTANTPADISYCYAFIAGVHDTMQAYEVWLNLKESCSPPGLMQADFRRVFLSYLAAYPDTKKGQAASSVVVAFKTAFPCAVVPEPLSEEAPKSPNRVEVAGERNDGH